MNYKEAFALMKYRCKTCGQWEIIWNSRDGVTPFVIGCRFCGGEASHVDWAADLYRPDWQPQPGDRIFRDGSPEEAAEIMHNRIERMRDRFPISDAQAEELIADARDPKDECSEFRPGWPKLVEVAF